METFAAKHAAKIHGTLSCFDRVLFRGYLPLMSGFAMADFLRIKQIDRWKLKPFLLEQAERIKKHALVMASQTGRPHQYLSEPSRKEDLARKIAERDGISEGFVCVFFVVEPCRTFSLVWKEHKAFIHPLSRTDRILFEALLSGEYALHGFEELLQVPLGHVACAHGDEPEREVPEPGRGDESASLIWP